MTVESNHTIAIATLSDWFKNLAPVYQPMRKTTKTIRDLHATCMCDFYCAFHGIATNLDRFSALFAPRLLLL